MNDKFYTYLVLKSELPPTEQDCNLMGSGYRFKQVIYCPKTQIFYSYWEKEETVEEYLENQRQKKETPQDEARRRNP